MVCFTEMHLVPQISCCLPNRSSTRSDNQDKYQSFLLEFDDNVFECVHSLCYNGALFLSLVSKLNNQMLDMLLVFCKNNLLTQNVFRECNVYCPFKINQCNYWRF